MTLRDYAEHVGKTAEVLWIDEIPWVLRDRILRPLAMPHQMEPVHRFKLRATMKESAALLAQWTEQWDTTACDWWYVCCDQKDYDVSNLRKTPRHDVRRGLENCDVRIVDGQWFAANGYPVYAAAFKHYGAKPVLTESDFVAEFRRHAAYPGRETWGAFIDGTLIAWESCVVIDDAVISASAKSDPNYFRARPNNALVYVLTKHYLCERGFRYVNSGARALVHDTRVQEFQERMGYRKIFCPLRTELSRVAALATTLRLQTWARRLGLGKLLSRQIEKLDGLAAAKSISRSCLKVTNKPKKIGLDASPLPRV